MNHTLVNAYLVCNTKYQMAKDSRMIGVGGRGVSVATGRLWRMAVLAAAAAIGTGSQAEAALYYWSDSDSGVSQPGPTVPQRRQTRRHQGKKTGAIEKESAKPQGPLIISISIDKQKMRIYDANGLFAETPISTGMAGHATPMGVFSVIQKQKLHHSNIYSGAPMPYMQRITWSGIAIHAGVLPGYPASHGCIRMPMAFALKMWNWTRMGARVVVTPGEMTPASFSHPLLAAQKAVPQPVAANEPPAETPPAAKADKTMAAATASMPAIAETSLELRSTVGHDNGVKAVMKAVLDGPPGSPPLREQTHTADAGILPATETSVTMTDATSSGNNAPPRDETVAATDAAPSTPADAVSVKADDTTSTETEPATAKHDEIASSDVKPPESKSPEAATADITQPSGDAATVDTSARESNKDGDRPDATKLEAKAGDVKADDVTAEVPKPDATKSGEKPDGAVEAVMDAGSGVADVTKDQTRLPDKTAPSKADPAAAAAPKHSGQIAVFISRKDSKLYVRQNFAPLFEAPVTIAPSDRPLGTHVFTAQVDKDDANVLHWSVVSLPAPARHAERRDEDERVSRRRKMAGAVEIKAMPLPDSPAEALDRLTIPADAMARIVEALSTGGSIIVSDQGIGGGETGEGTDFIVSLR
jgi:lipoprotein-anchoring transpeptidase ErfK/SrfK